ncbi:hypothetical protein LH51_01235 [Nitrincola sp. A-D6]|uniref:response regulator transcription factor n=1 Tax=Nitrincola sp. A-D6 TaxID=1545442 RepID=UPI00051FCF46|nr:response regulator transcription factor [Nitrincola sp. A-D6]KGK43284.1 hypothetical protein LH51_01235 [Nitrincola sp. A-D6]
MSIYRVAVLEDNDALREELVYLLISEGYHIESFGEAAAFMLAHTQEAYDILILDLGLPDVDGIDLARELSARREETGIIMLTARGELSDRIDGLSAGADTYLTKPFEYDELLAHISALLRRICMKRAQGVWQIDAARQQLEAPDTGAVFELTASEVVLLVELAKKHPSHVSRAELIRALGEDFMLYDERRLEKLISRLRTKLLESFNASPIKAIRGKGYIFKESIELKYGKL